MRASGTTADVLQPWPRLLILPFPLLRIVPLPEGPLTVHVLRLLRGRHRTGVSSSAECRAPSRFRMEVISVSVVGVVANVCNDNKAHPAMNDPRVSGGTHSRPVAVSESSRRPLRLLSLNRLGSLEDGEMLQLQGAIMA